MSINKLPIVYTDRSRIEEGQRCLRKRYWSYHYQLPAMLYAGLQPAKPALELTVGSAVHKGVEILLAEYMDGGKPNLDNAVAQGLINFDAAWQPWLERADSAQDRTNYADTQDRDSYSVQHDSVLSYQLTEAKALIEALIAAFYYAPTGLQLLVENYEILAVEQEIAVPLTDWLVLNSRPDAILRHRRTGQYFPWSLKTAKKWTDQTNEQAEVDNQGISESISTEYWLASQFLNTDIPGNVDSYTTAGVLMCYLIKGEKRLDEVDQLYKTASPLIRPYFNTQAFDLTDLANYAPSNKWTCTEEHEWKGARFNYQVNGKNGCPGGKNHLRGDSWQQVNIWEQGVRVSDWVRELFEQQPELGEKFVQVPAPYRRERDELDSWKRQVLYQEHAIAFEVIPNMQAALRLNNPNWTPEGALDKWFQQSRTNCTYPWRCIYYSVCHRGIGARLLDPTLFAKESDPTRGVTILDEISFVGRQPNHPEEAVIEEAVINE